MSGSEKRPAIRTAQAAATAVGAAGAGTSINPPDGTPKDAIVQREGKKSRTAGTGFSLPAALFDGESAAFENQDPRKCKKLELRGVVIPRLITGVQLLEGEVGMPTGFVYGPGFNIAKGVEKELLAVEACRLLDIYDGLVEARLHADGVGVTDVVAQQHAAPTAPAQQSAQQPAAPAQAYSFRYFQQLRGSVMLPEGFTPQRVRVSLRGDGAALEQTLPWGSAGQTADTPHPTT